MATLKLPAGWRRVESTGHPGEYYYLGPHGSTWMHPVTGEAAVDAAAPTSLASATTEETPRRRFKHTTIYRQDFKELPSEDVVIERIDRMTLYNPSTAPHPKARREFCLFNSTTRTDYPWHHAVAEPPAHQWTIPMPVGRLGTTSTYRTDFISRPVHSSRTTRTHTPPKKTKFLYSSTQRDSYSPRAVGAAKEPGDAAPPKVMVPPLKADMSSFVITDAVPRPPSGPAVASSSTRSKRRTNYESGTNLYGFGTPDGERPASSTYRDNFRKLTDSPRNHRLEVRDFAHRPWYNGLNPSTPDQFESLYARSYTDSHTKGTLPSLLKTCHDFDLSVSRRAKAHQELSQEV